MISDYTNDLQENGIIKIITNKKKKNYFKDSNLIEEFFTLTKFDEANKNGRDFYFEIIAGSAIIFNEGGIHRGSKTLLSDRMVLRYLYSITKN